MTKQKQQTQEPNIADQAKRFVADSIMFYQKCKKPDYTEYMKILQACIIGFLIMGAIGYFIKLVFIPINNIILSWSGQAVWSIYLLGEKAALWSTYTFTHKTTHILNYYFQPISVSHSLLTQTQAFLTLLRGIN